MAKMPKVVVVSNEIFRIQRPSIDTFDNVAISARMNAVETRIDGMDKNVSELLKTFKDMISSQMNPPVLPLLNPQGQGSQQLDQCTLNSSDSTQSWAAMASADTRGRSGIPSSRSLEVPGASNSRSRSGSKRSFDDMEYMSSKSDISSNQNQEGQWNKVNRKRSINYGKAKVTSGKSDVAVAPFEVFIANTHPSSTPDLIKEILIECADLNEARKSPLEVLNIKCMANKERFPIPRTLCWKVTVPHRERDHMMKDESYPEGWGHRRFFPPKDPVPALKPSMPAAKQSRIEVTNA